MKYTVITGASSGIGYETAKVLAKKGKSLVLVARRTDELEKLRDEVKALAPDSDVILRSVDLTESVNVHELYDSLKDLDIETWINNAGFGDFDNVKDVSVPKVEKMLRLNIEALTVLTSRYVHDYHDVEGTTVLNVSSGGGYRIVPNAVTYCATKFYVSAYTEGLAQELKNSGAKLQAKVLAPAATETEFADRSRGEAGFDYSKNVAKYHTAAEMATFLDQLLNSDQIVGIVNAEDYSFELRGPLFTYVGANK
ncbi:short-chain dehydrogenase/reductase SDR [Exiguobacterium sibiricum 255-15]|uniref:Short-chain dehydrogenase/reductase SDR n=1 Tax=Exiguobacterium sibiricum (strain DSM 17290 / CCUG 55495 / CIP 109462 / JCM 13490 / 255-15) TaxID=262543 RepID=B1YFH5_EXIS2|nr:SDR family NAD(P)-dependent oxidoreductase [Exiguobacterium sibiricum]ACB60851.1 short-chain dehydrogenase/reductase SDR [Exiguobacterium sibiricum 255-15]